MVRSFVAIDLSEEIRRKIRESQDLLERCDARLSIVAPANIHITLKFLGEIEPSAIGPILEALESVSGEPFEVTIGRAVCNPPSRPRVVWCGIQDAGGCADLSRQVETLLEPLGFKRERRAFTPHATLARVKRFDPSLLRQVESLPETPIGSCEVRSIRLKKSTLTPRGSIYEDLGEVLL